MWNLENVGECCKVQWVWVHQRIALYKSYLLLLLYIGKSMHLRCCTSKTPQSSEEKCTATACNNDHTKIQLFLIYNLSLVLYCATADQYNDVGKQRGSGDT